MTVAPEHLRLDLSLSVARAQASHDSYCPDIGPICAQRAEPPQQHHTTLWLTELRLLGEYGLSSKLAVQALLPLRIIDTRTRFTDLAGNPITLDYLSIHHRDETLVGLGDAQLLLHGAWRIDAVRFGGRLGMSLPTGVVHANPYRLGELGQPHEHIQLGTGTFDPVAALDISKSFGASSLSGFGYAQVPLYRGSTGYQAGARISGGLTASSGFGQRSASFRFAASALHERAERWDGVVPTDDGNQGRTDVYLGPGATLPFGTDWSFSADVRIRVYGHTVNAQLDLPVVVEFGIGRLLHLEQGEHEEISREPATSGDVLERVTHGEAAPLEAVPGKWTLFDFWAPWCEACKTLDARLRELAAKDDRLAIRRINIVDFDSAIAHQELGGVSTLPYVRLVSPSGDVVWQASATPDEAMAAIQQRLR